MLRGVTVLGLVFDNVFSGSFCLCVSVPVHDIVHGGMVPREDAVICVGVCCIGSF